MENHRPSRFRRIFALVAIVLNVAFNYLYTRLPLGLEDMKTVSDRYENSFTPAPYAFAIWGLIYLSWFLYALYALLPSQRRNPLHDGLCGLLILLNVLGSAWIYEFTVGFVGISMFVIAAMAVTGAVLYLRVFSGTRSRRLAIPFSLFAGWISVAVMANFMAWLSSRGSLPGGISLTVGLIALAAVLSIFVGWRFRDAVYPLVIAWATLAIGVRQHALDPRIALAGFVAAGVAGIVAIVSGVRSLRPA